MGGASYHDCAKCRRRSYCDCARCAPSKPSHSVFYGVGPDGGTIRCPWCGHVESFDSAEERAMQAHWAQPEEVLKDLDLFIATAKQMPLDVVRMATITPMLMRCRLHVAAACAKKAESKT